MTEASHAAAGPVRARLRDTELRPVRREDARVLFPLIHGVPGVVRWLSWEGPARVEDLEERYATWRAGALEEPLYTFAVTRASDGEVLGEASLRFDDHPGVGELGYWLGEPHRGRGHGRDAVELLARFGFEHVGAFALTARVKEGNEASMAVLEAAGFRPESAPGIDGSDEDPPIAWIYSATRRADLRREGRPEIALLPDPGRDSR